MPWFDEDGHVGRHINSWISNYIKYYYVSIQFVGILNSWISIPTKYTKLDIQRIKMISQY